MAEKDIDLSTKTYTQLVAQAVKDFDDIFTAMANKGVVHEGTGIVIDNGTLPTQQYAGLITGQLVRVSGVDANINSLKGVTSGIMANHSGDTFLNLVEGSGSLTYGTNGGLAAKLAVPAGYYDGDNMDVTIPLAAIATNSNIVLPTTLAAATADEYTVEVGDKYVIKPTDGHIITSLSLDKGAVSVSIGEEEDGLGNSEGAFTNDLAVSVANKITYVDTLSAVNYVDEAHKTSDTSVYKLKIDTSSKLSGTITANVTATLTPGYINDFTTKDLQGTETITDAVGGSDVRYIEIGKGAISNIKGAASSALTVQSGVVTATKDVVGTDTDNYYKIQATTSAEIDTSKATITEGYIKQGAVAINTDDVTLTDAELYIKKGSLGDATGNAATLSTGELTVKDNFGTTQTGDYTVTATVNKAYSKDIDDGYIPAAEKTFEANITGTNTLSIAHGSVAVTSTGNAISESGDIGIIKTSGGTDAYKIDVTALVTENKTVTPGYVKDADVTLPTTTSLTGTTSYYVDKGHVTVVPDVKVSAVNRADDKKGDDSTVEGFTSLFSTTVPTKGDYYAVESGIASPTVVAGYVTSSDITSEAKTTYYIPKATFKYIPADDNGGKDLLEVETGGYVPSGTITSIAEITGTLDAASIALAIDTEHSGDIFKASSATGDYKLSLSRGTVDAGYFSATQGTLTGDFYVSHGSVKVTQTPANITLAATPTTVDEENHTYTFFAEANQVAGITGLKEGYIKEDDIDLTEVTKKASATLTLGAAQFATKSGSQAKLNIESSDVILSTTDDSGYLIKPVVADGGITIATTTPGYLGAGEERAATITAEEKLVYVKKGTALTNATATLAASSTNMTAAEDGTSLVITLAARQLDITGTLEEGYYKSATERAVSGKASIGAQTYTVSPAAATASVSESNNVLTSGDTTLKLEGSQADGKEYVSVTGTASQTVVAKVTTDGYLTADSQIDVTQPTNATDTKYIEVWKEGRDTVNTWKETSLAEPKTVNTVTVGDTADHDPTSSISFKEVENAGKFNKYDTQVKLADHAMGQSVVDQFELLRKRLEGVSTTAA